MQVPKPDLSPSTYQGQGHPVVPFDPACRRCPFGGPGRGPVGGAGPNDLRRVKLLVISDYPGRYEVDEGYPFVVVNDVYRKAKKQPLRWANAGALLRHGLGRLGLDTYTDCWLTNVLKCRAPDDKKVTETQVKVCAEVWLKQELDAITQACPGVPIWIAGALALRVFCQTTRWPVEPNVNLLRRQVLSWYQHPVVVTWNPAVYARSEFREAKAPHQPHEVYPIFSEPLPLTPLWMFYQDLEPLASLVGRPSA